MEKHRHITEEDLLITEALIAKSYYQLKESVVQAPSEVFRSAGQTARRHPYATAGAAIIAGVAIYGIFKMVTSRSSSHGAQGRSRSTLKKDPGRPDVMQQLLPMLIPLVAPYIGEYIQKYLGKMFTENTH